MKNFLLAGCGLWGLCLCRMMELDAIVYIPFGIVVLTAAMEMGGEMLGIEKRTKKYPHLCGQDTGKDI